MAHGKLYRSFIILQEDERGHSLANDKPLSGYAKIEVKNDKCKVAFYAQNLKKEYSKCSMLLICAKKDTELLLNLGSMNITPQGKAEVSLEFDANNIGNTNVSYEKVVGAALCKADGSIFKFLMCGFLNGEKPASNWKDYKKVTCAIHAEANIKVKGEVKVAPKMEMKHESKPVQKVEMKHESKPVQKVEMKHESKPVQKVEMKCESKPVQKVEMKCESKPVQKVEMKHESKPVKKVENTANECGCPKSRSKYEDYESSIDDSKVNIVESYEENSVDEREVEEENNIADNIVNNEVLEENNIPNSYEEYVKNRFDNDDIGRYTRNEEDFEIRGTMGEFFERIVDSLEETRCTNEIKKCKWFKVPVKNFDTLCNISDYNKYTALYYPMTNYYPYISKEGHFMIGLKCDEYGVVKYIVYGIKGSKDKKCQPYDGKTGFVTWTPMAGQHSDMGYWLMFYDFKNNVVVVPSR